MSGEAIPLHIEDVGAFAHGLRRELGLEVGHDTVLDAVARAAGFRDHRHLRAVRGAAGEEAPDLDAVGRARRRFDAKGRLAEWSGRRSVRLLCLWPLWAKLPRGPLGGERAVSALLDQLATFGDAATLRREMVDLGLLERTRDGSAYVRASVRPGPTERALIAAVMAVPSRARR